MKDIRFITRADDAGSNHSANRAIANCIRAGFIKNVSVMAPGAYVSEAADLFAKNKSVCFGMHATLNAEWDKVKWMPVSTLPKSSGLIDEQGMFLPNPKLFLETKPDIAVIIKELDAQLDKLTRAGFSIGYVDSHMLFEAYIPGLDEAMKTWAREKGLLFHLYYYALPPGFQKVMMDSSQLLPVLKVLPSGQYFYVAHPAYDSAEMRLTGNNHESGETVARERDKEARTLDKAYLKWLMRLMGIRPIRYDEAIPDETLTIRDIIAMFNG